MGLGGLSTRLRSVIRQIGDEATAVAKSQGLRLEAGDLADWVSQYSPRAAKGLLTSAVNLTRPFTRGLGIWVSEYSAEQIEIKIPDQERLRGSSGGIHEALLYAVASEALHLMWEKDLAGTKIKVKSFEVEILAELTGTLRCRFELLEMDRQRLVFESAQKSGDVESVAVLPILGGGDRRVAQVTIQYKIEPSQVKRLSEQG